MTLKQRLSWTEEPLYLIDGTSFLYRAFYAFPDLARSDGFPTNALFIVLRLMLKIIREETPEYCCFILDGPGPTFRHELYASYKAGRQKMPESLDRQIDPLKQGIGLLGIKLIETQGNEADDYIATLAARFKSSLPVVIIASDKDLYQCLDNNVVIWDPGQRSEKLITLQSFQSENGLSPEQWTDFQALVGDASDNIPGVPGIGPKTAQKLLQKYPNLNALKDNLNELPPKEKDKLKPHLEAVFLYKQLVQLDLEAGDYLHKQDLKCRTFEQEQLKNFFEEYELKSLLQEVSASTSLDSPKGSRINRQKPPNMSELKDEEVGLYFQGKDDFLLGLKEQEYLLQMPASRILEAGKAAKQLYLYPYKEILRHIPQPLEAPEESCIDLALAAYLLNPEERDYSWKRIFSLYQHEIKVHSENKGLATLRIGRILKKRLQADNLLQLLYQIEMPLIPLLLKMEKKGICIDLPSFREFLQEVESHLEKLTTKIYVRAGEKFNLRSTQQLAEILFHKLQLKPGRKTPGGMPSTSSQVLENLQHQHPIIADILEFRKMEKLRSTYLSPLPKLVDKQNRLHTSFNQMGTATGRLSSSNPNLQNIPIRGDLGKRLRSCFIAPPNKYLVAADYSQIELRILAHMSDDPQLVQAFAANEDIHAHTASVLLEKPLREITPEERRKAKTINFGLLYGMGPQKLGRETGLGLQKAKEFISLYFSRLNGVKQFFEQVEHYAKENGFVTTIAGRRRWLKDINSRNENLAGQARRMAINTVIQGSAADIIKMAMLQVDAHAKLREMNAELILQIHDELLLEAPREFAEEAGELVAGIMSRVYPLKVPLLITWGIGSDWASAH